MYSKTFITFLFIISLAGSLHSQSYNSNYNSDPNLYGGVVTGYNG